MPFPLICLSTMPPELWLLLAVVIVSAIARLLSPECTAPHEIPSEHSSLESEKPKPPPNNDDVGHTPLPSTRSNNSTANEQNENPEQNETDFEAIITEYNKDTLQKVDEVICNQSFKSEDLHFSAEEIMVNESQEKGCDFFELTQNSVIKALFGLNLDKSHLSH